MSAPAVAVSSDGRKFAASWKDVRAGKPNVYWAISDQPNFAQDLLVHDKILGKQNHPSIAIDASGTVWVAWEDNQFVKQHIRIRSSAASDEARAISDESEGWAGFPVVACNAGLVAVTYEVEKDGKRAVMFRLIEPGQESVHTDGK